MTEPIINQTLSTPLEVLDKILALNLDITLWSARTKLTAEDFGGAELPPEDLASLGSKRICDPARLSVFTKLKARAVTLLNKHGVRFLSGWAIPEDKAGDIIQELCAIRDEFFTEKQSFLATYDEGIAEWIARHPAWAGIIQNSTVSRDYVDGRMKFAWQIYRVAPASGRDARSAMPGTGLTDEVKNLGNTLFSEISRDASEIWRKVLEGKTEVTHKALSPLKTMRDKLLGLSFVEPHVVPVIGLIETALGKMPKKGTISGAPLLMLQGLVCILKEESTLISQTQTLLAVSSQDDLGDVLDSFISLPAGPVLNLDDLPQDDIPQDNSGDPVLLPTYTPPALNLDSMGLW